MDYKLLLKVTVKSAIYTIAWAIGIAALMLGVVLFHEWSKPYAGYIIVSILMLGGFIWGVVESYNKALKKKG